MESVPWKTLPEPSDPAEELEIFFRGRPEPIPDPGIKLSREKVRTQEQQVRD